MRQFLLSIYIKMAYKSVRQRTLRLYGDSPRSGSSNSGDAPPTEHARPEARALAAIGTCTPGQRCPCPGSRFSYGWISMVRHVSDISEGVAYEDVYEKTSQEEFLIMKH